VRRALVIVLCAAGLVALAVVQTMGYAGGNLLWSDRFGASVSRALETDAGADALARVVVDDLSGRAERAGTPLPPAVQLRVGAVVAGLARSGVLGRPLAPAAAEAHRDLLAGEDEVSLALGVVRPEVAAGVARLSAAAAELVPPAAEFPELRVPLGPGAQRAGEVLGDARGLTRWAAPLAVVLLGLAVLLAPRRDRLLRTLGLAVLGLALLPLAVRGALRLSAAAAASRDEDLARALADALCDGWVRATVLTAALGAGLLVASRLVRR
jgi:hypothetical protein